MSWTSSLTGEAVLGLLLAGLLVALALWFSWRKPTWLLLLALASLAVQPQVLIGGSGAAYDWGLHQTLFVFALAINALRYGVRRTINWPMVALLATFALSLAFGNLHPKLTLPFMLMSLAILALPFAFTQVVLEPGSRRSYALTIALTPLLSVLGGGLLQAFGVTSVLRVGRLEGAAGDGAIMALMAFVGLCVAVHESTRPGRAYLPYIALANLAFVIMTVGRMAFFASAVFLGAYLMVSRDFRLSMIRRGWTLIAGSAAVLGIFFSYGSMLEGRIFYDGGSHLEYDILDQTITVDLSVRDKIWHFYLEEFSKSPVFGRGIGAGFIAANDWVPWPRKTPHNEYIHLLVSGGVVGFIAFASGIFVYFRRLYSIASPNDREFLSAFLPAVALFAVTDDVLVFPVALGLYCYLAMVLTPPTPHAPPDTFVPRRPSHHDS